MKVLNRIGRGFSPEGVDGLSYAMSEEFLDQRSRFFRRPGFTLCAHHCVDCCSAKFACDRFLSKKFCLSVFHIFLIMLIAQSVRSQFISYAPIDSAFWSCCLLFFPRLLLIRMIVTFSPLISSIYFSPTYPIADADAKLRL
jgi:hypothetical protein